MQQLKVRLLEIISNLKLSTLTIPHLQPSLVAGGYLNPLPVYHQRPQ